MQHDAQKMVKIDRPYLSTRTVWRLKCKTRQKEKEVKKINYRIRNRLRKSTKLTKREVLAQERKRRETSAKEIDSPIGISFSRWDDEQSGEEIKAEGIAF